MNRSLKVVGITVLALAALGAGAALLLRNQIDRHQKDLFSPQPLRRLACLGHMAGAEATVDNITLLRDFVAWEPRGLLKNRAKVILERMEDQAREDAAAG